MLPQLFGTQNDENYFREVSGEFPVEAVTVIPDHYSCEVQQAIIRNAEIVVGARYHSVIFSIKNRVPFVALSYEHKISNMLTVAGLEDLMFDLQEIRSLDKDLICEKICSVLRDSNTIRPRVSGGCVKVSELAGRTVEEFITRFSLKC